MKCSTVRKALIDQRCGDKLTTQMQEEIDEHSANCADCQEWKAFHEVFVQGPGAAEIRPPAIVPQQKNTAIKTRQTPLGNFLGKLPSIPIIKFAGAAIVVALMFAVYFGVTQPEDATVQFYQVGGHGYQVVSLDSAASDLTDLDLELLLGGGQTDSNDEPFPLQRRTRFNDGPFALQSNPRSKGVSRGQLVRMEKPLARVFTKSIKKKAWARIRSILEKQHIELPSATPKHLVIPDRLIELLSSDLSDVELWMIQPTPTVVVFHVRE